MFTNASAVYHGHQVAVTFPFDRILVERLKTEIPAYARTFVPETKEWIVEATYAARAVRLLQEHFPDARGVNAPHQTPSSASDRDVEYATLYVIPDAPPEVVKAAYRALSKLYHPDRGGDGAAMQRINEAYSQIESRLSTGGRV